MGYFTEWLDKKCISEEIEDIGSPADAYRFNSEEDGMVANDHDQIKSELFRLVYDKYTAETMQFLDGIAQRGDEEVNNLLKKLKANSPSDFKEPRHPSDSDEVVPPEADTGQGGEFED